MSESRTARWSRRKEARPAELLSAALECFTERGFAATRLDDVAARAGVTKGTVYLYFPNKVELFKAVVRASLVPFIERVEQTAAEGSAADVLRRLGSFWAERVLPTPASAIPKLVIAEAGNFPDLARFYLDEVVSRARKVLAGVLRRGIASGEFRPVEVEHVVYCLLAPFLLATLWKHSLGPFDGKPMDPGMLRTHIDLFLTGIAAGPALAKRRRPPANPSNGEDDGCAPR